MNNEQKLVLYLGKNFGQGFTTHNLSIKLDIPYATFYRLINRLRDSELLSFNKVGRAEVVSLNVENDIIVNYLAVSSDIERIKYLEEVKLISKIYESIVNCRDIVVLFGSYASKKFKKKSDVDILIINGDGKNSVSFYKYELLFDIKINPICVSRKEFVIMLKDNEENLGKQVLKNNIVLNKPNDFWRLVYSGF